MKPNFYTALFIHVSLITNLFSQSPTAWQAVGPVGMSPGGNSFQGRITAIQTDPSNSNIVYLGAETGGYGNEMM